MDTFPMETFPFVSPAYLIYLAVFAVAAAGCLAGAWQARRISLPGVRRGLTGLLLASGLWALCHVGVVLSSGLALKVILYEVGLVIGFATVWAWFWLCSSYSGRALHRKKSACWAAVVVFAVVSLSKLTNPWHGLYFSAELSAGPFRHLVVDHHVGYWITSALSYALAAVGFFMLSEPLRRAKVGSGKLAGLFALTALPLGANAIGYATPYLLDLSHEPVGVAAFALGALVLKERRLEETSRTGQEKRPNLVLSAGGRIRNYNRAAERLFSALRGEELLQKEEIAGSYLEETLPRLARALGGETLGREPEESRKVEGDERPSKKKFSEEDGILKVTTGGEEARYFRPLESTFRRSGDRLVTLRDVTERELRRRERVSRLQAISDNMPGVAFEFRAGPSGERSVEFVGEEAESFLGFSPKSGRFYENFVEHIPDEHREEFLQSVEEAAESRSGWKQEFPFGRPGGEQMWFLGSAEPEISETEEGEEVLLFRGLLLDITGRKETERKLRRERDRLETLFESLPSPIVRCRVEGGQTTVEEANPAFAETFPVGREEAKGQDLNDLLVPAGRGEAAVKIDRRAVEEGPAEHQVRRVAAGRELRDFRLQVAGRQLEGNSEKGGSKEGPAELYAIYTDVTRQKRREETLRRQKNLLERTQQLAGAWEADLQTGEVSWSDRIYEIHEMEPGSEIDLEKGLSFYTPESRERLLEATETLVREGRPYDLELQVTTAKSSRRWLRVAGAPAEFPAETSGGTEDSEKKVTKVAGALQDITQRKEEERRRRQVIARVTDGILRVDSEWQVTLVNDQAEAVYGTDEEEMLKRSLWEVFGELDGSRFEEIYRKAMQSRKPAEIEAYHSGIGEWIQEQVYPNEDGGLSFYFRVITERKEREEALREAKSRYQTLIENFPDGGAYLFDEDLRYVLAGGEKLGVVGGPEEVIGSTVHDIFPEEVADRQTRYFRRALEGKRCEFEEEYGGRRYRVQALPVRDEDGTVISGIAFAQDITEQKRRKEELERKNDLFERAQEIASVGAWEHDVASGELRWTDQVYRIYGHKDPSGSAPPVENAIKPYHPDDRPVIREAFTEAVEKGIPYDIEVRLITEDEEQKWVRTRGEPQREDGDLEGEVARVRGTIQDITDRKEQEEALRAAKDEAEQARQEAEEASRLKSAFLANMSHEIRTPLTSIIGFAEMLGLKAAELELPEDSPLPGYADMIEQGGKRLLDTLEGVLNLSKLQAGQMEMEAGLVDLPEQARLAAEELWPSIEEKEISLELETGGPVAGRADPVVAEADEGGVQIVLRNLLSNAIKYTEEGSVVVRTYQDKDGRAVLEVEDTGIGMDPEVAESLFEPFRQASEGMSREYEGTGIGLAVTREAVAQMGGSVEVETEKGAGTCMTVRLPGAEVGKPTGD